MKLPSLTIGPYTAPVPLIQGGMSIRVSTAALAVPVAECGGIGVIGGSGLPVPELQEDIAKAKRQTKGIIAVNIMFAMKGFRDLVASSCELAAHVGRITCDKRRNRTPSGPDHQPGSLWLGRISDCRIHRGSSDHAPGSINRFE